MSFSKSKKINREIKIGIAIMSCYIIWALAWFIYSRVLNGSFLSPYIPVADMTKELIAPGVSGYFLGTDVYGRSLLEILSVGLNYSLYVAFMVSSLAVSIGIIAGYLSIRGHRSIKFFSDLLINLVFVFPSILIAIMVMSTVGQSFWGLVFALVITGWPAYARIARGESQRVLTLSYVEAATAVGVSELRLFFTIIIPSILPLMMIHIVLGISGVIVSEAMLGFLGLGGSEYSWGVMLSMAKSVLLEAPYLVIIIGLAMAGLIVGLNLIGDGLRDYLDPKVVKEKRS